jgi:hypothetical protein
MIPKSVQAGSNNWNLNFCDGACVYAGSGYVAGRGAGGSSAYGGVGCLDLSDGASVTIASFGSRLLYNGKVTVVSEL